MAEADDSAGERDGGQGAGEPQPCMPCRGSGRVISNLGGARSELTCPWCRGSGVRIEGVDAQEHQRERAAAKAG
jgi:DnaJ-class molecular chaperone